MTTFCVKVQSKLIDQNACHVIDFCVDFAFHVGEDEVHAAVVGIGNNINIEGSWACRRSRLVMILHPVERAEKPKTTLDAFAQGAVVEDFGSQPNSVAHVVDDGNAAASAVFAERFNRPVVVVFKDPCHGVPDLAFNAVVQRKLVRVDVELSGCDDPVRVGVVRVHRKDGGGVGWQGHAEVKVDDAIATMDVLDRVRVES